MHPSGKSPFFTLCVLNCDPPEHGCALDQKYCSRNEACDRLRKEKGLQFVPPFDHPDVIAGQVID